MSSVPSGPAGAGDADPSGPSGVDAAEPTAPAEAWAPPGAGPHDLRGPAVGDTRAADESPTVTESPEVADTPTGPSLAVPSGARPLHPRQVDVWRVGWGIAAAVLVGVVLAAESVARMAGEVGLPWPWPSAAVAVAVVAAVAVGVFPRLAYDRWRYELAEETLELRRGVVVHGHTAIPYFRVQHIDITRGPVERLLGLSELVVRTAAAATDATIPGIAAADAEGLRDVILARTGRDDAV